jgi:hypothetical protein
MTVVWIVIIEDRHQDVDALPFSTMPGAMSYARSWTLGVPDVEELELTEDMARDGWILCLEYGTEVDHVRVVERELDGPLSRSLATVK